MKELVDRKKLDDMLDKEALSSQAKTDRRGCAVLTVGHVKTLLVLCKLSPPDLEAMNLATLGVLEKVKEYLEGKVDDHLVGVRNLIRNLESDVSKSEPITAVLNKIRGRAVKCDLRKGGARCGCCELVLADLESSVDLGAAKETLEKARAWEILSKNEKALGLGHEMKTALAQARLALSKANVRELEKGEDNE